MNIGIALLSWFLLTIGATYPQQPPQQASTEPVVKQFLQQFAGPRARNEETRFAHALFDLNADGKPESVVYLVGRYWCGSGGCPMLILTPEGPSYRVVTKTTVTQPPIRVLRSTAHGWRSLAVQVYGGGITPREVELVFDGSTYPTNPSSARPVSGNPTGDVLIDDIRTSGQYLYDR